MPNSGACKWRTRDKGHAVSGGENLVADAVKDALRMGAPSFDAVKQLILCRIDKRPPRLDLASYPYLPKAAVQSTRAADYTALLDQEAA